MKKKLVKFIKKPIVYISLILIILIGGGIFLSSRPKEAVQVTAQVERKSLEQIVSVTGNVKASSFVSLAFERSGRIKGIYADVGQNIRAGEALISLENGDVLAQYNQSTAGVKATQAKLEQLKAGSSPENIVIAETELQNAKKSAVNTINEVDTSINDVVENKADGFFSNPKTSSPTLNLSVDSTLKNTLQNQRVGLQVILNNTNPVSISSDLTAEFNKAKGELNKVKIFFDSLAVAVNSLEANSSLSQTTIDSYKSTISSARTTIDGQISDITSAEATVTLEQSQLALARNPARPEEIKAQEALVEEAQAGVENAAAQLAKTTLRSPINGTVTQRNGEVGEIVSANSIVMAVISKDKFKIETNVPEADIAKVGVGNVANVSLDAYGRDTIFPTKVIAIDPAETVIDGVSTYKVTLQFITEDERIKSGMTANIDIVTAKKEGILAIPQRALIRKDGIRIVRVLVEKEIEERKVETGIVGFDGFIEILSGLKEGETIVVFSDN